jgi:hypothetical protein
VAVLSEADLAAMVGEATVHQQKPWKLPVPQFIEHLYRKRFARKGTGSSFRWRLGHGRQGAGRAWRNATAESTRREP